ncbi:exported hypothetical protein [Candidatus Sulfopaludibacter sp. SbA3]|nr:exported hypothetical protein [Candidatus Sulfopaludibacter sp. SbA3]
MQLSVQTGVREVESSLMFKSFRRFLGLGLLGVMLVTAIPTFASPQRGGQRKGKKGGGKRGGSKRAPTKGGGRRCSCLRTALGQAACDSRLSHGSRHRPTLRRHPRSRLFPQ